MKAGPPLGVSRPLVRDRSATLGAARRLGRPLSLFWRRRRRPPSAAAPVLSGGPRLSLTLNLTFGSSTFHAPVILHGSAGSTPAAPPTRWRRALERQLWPAARGAATNGPPPSSRDQSREVLRLGDHPSLSRLFHTHEQRNLVERPATVAPPPVRPAAARLFHRATLVRRLESRPRVGDVSASPRPMLDYRGHWRNAAPSREGSIVKRVSRGQGEPAAARRSAAAAAPLRLAFAPARKSQAAAAARVAGRHGARPASVTPAQRPMRAPELVWAPVARPHGSDPVTPAVPPPGASAAASPVEMISPRSPVAPSPAAAAVAAPPPDMNRIVDEVMRRIDRQMRSEKLRRGI